MVVLNCTTILQRGIRSGRGVVRAWLPLSFVRGQTTCPPTHTSPATFLHPWVAIFLAIYILFCTVRHACDRDWQYCWDTRPPPPTPHNYLLIPWYHTVNHPLVFPLPVWRQHKRFFRRMFSSILRTPLPSISWKHLIMYQHIKILNPSNPQS